MTVATEPSGQAGETRSFCRPTATRSELGQPVQLQFDVVSSMVVPVLLSSTGTVSCPRATAGSRSRTAPAAILIIMAGWIEMLVHVGRRRRYGRSHTSCVSSHWRGGINTDFSKQASKQARANSKTFENSPMPWRLARHSYSPLLLPRRSHWLPFISSPHLLEL